MKTNLAQLQDQIKLLQRELEVETALERFRSRILDMQNSSELEEITAAMYQQLDALGIVPEGAMVYIVIVDTKTDTSHQWIITEGTLTRPPEELRTPMSEDPRLIKTYEAWKRKDPLLIRDLSGDELEDFKKYLKSLPSFLGLESELDQWPNRLVWSEASFSNGTLGFICQTPLPAATLAILVRFSKDFDLAYTRFLDLQKAEAQAREAQIEAALEKVRSSAMAMHSSKDLHKVTEELRKQIGQLDHRDLETCAIHLYDESPDYFVSWAAMLSPDSESDIVNSHVHFPKTGVEIFEEMIEGYNSDKKDYVIVNEGKKMVAFLEMLKHCAPAAHQVVTNTFKDFKPKDIRSFWTISDFSGGSLVITTITRPDSATHNLLRRLADVFGLAYRRFADLQKAEAQAREARIEAALERVRAQTIAMHSSEDVGKCIVKMFSELTELGVSESTRCGIGIFDHSNENMELWTASKDEKDEVSMDIGNLDMASHPLLKSARNAWKDQQIVNLYLLQGKDLREYYEIINAAPDYSVQIDINRLPERIFHYDFVFDQGIIYAFSHQVLSDELIHIFQRFSLLFQQTYRRYLDLIKAEAQARDAEIEVSLERVRSQAMGMHKSEDLQYVVATIFEQFQFLQLSTLRCGIGIIDGERREVEVWTTTQTEEGLVAQVSGKERLQGHKLLANIFKHWQQQKLLLYRLKGAELLDYYKKGYNNKFMTTLREDPDKMEHYYICAYFSSGGLYAFKESEFNEAEIKIVQRFADVFHLAYTRYEDLQKAEIRAREAIKSASMDRVRAVIASMRTSEDLEKITPLVWKELTVLDVPFFRCGIFIISEEAKNVQVLLTTPSGDSQTSLLLPFGSSEVLTATIDSWRKNEIFKDRWTKERFIAWTNSVVSQGFVKNTDEYYVRQAPDRIALHFLPFAQGMLYIGSDEALADDKLKVAQALADVFAVAYARYEDFQHLEEANARIEEALKEVQATQAQLIQSEKMASLGELTAGIAHEIQNPLNFVNNFSELNEELIRELAHELNLGNLDEVKSIIADLIQNEEKIKHHGKRAEGIVKSMLQHSRTSEGQKEPTDINELCDEYLRLAFHGFRAKDKSFNAGFKTDFDPDLPDLEVIPQDMGRVLLNLINNAFQATSAEALTKADGNYKPTVSVTTKKLEERIEIQVSDNGPGIPEEIKDKIFQPFFTTKPTGQGTGLGLSLSYDIVKAHGGELRVETKEGKGSEFIIQLPVV